jgi:hypothetical protein
METVDHAQVATGGPAPPSAMTRRPSDLAERLEHRIEHLLVDEFQDTSSGFSSNCSAA